MQKLLWACLIISISTHSIACRDWSYPKPIGYIDKERIPESSGIAQSKIIKDRLYHINDSGDSGRFFMTDLEGRKTQEVGIVQFDPMDAEDIDIGPCDNSDSCLYFGDIGDNFKIRKSISVVLIKEQVEIPNPVIPYKRLTLKYPDKAHNAEGLAVHPNGDLYILTKDEKFLWWTRNSRLYRLKKEKVEEGGTQKLEFVGLVKNHKVLSRDTVSQRLLTAFDIHPSGKKFMILSYERAVEFYSDLSTQKEHNRYKVIDLDSLRQQEAISYLNEGNSFVYTTENSRKDSPILESKCRSTKVNYN